MFKNEGKMKKPVVGIIANYALINGQYPAQSTGRMNIDAIADIVEQPSLSWLKADNKKFTIKVTSAPKREEAEPDINEQLIVEYYSR